MPDGQQGTGQIDVAYVAHLARLHITDAEAAQFQAQLQQVVDYVDKLNTLDLSGIEPTSHAHPLHNVMRADRARPGLEPRQVLNNAPDSIEGLIRVPKIVE